MDLNLSPDEVRILGCLIEKESTTPDNYPLSLNALTNACNQKSNRVPVMLLSEAEVMDAAEALAAQSIIFSTAESSHRIIKYSHRIKDRLRDELNFTAPELAILSVLFVRGPQTTGELRTRTTRIHNFASLKELQDTVANLEQREDGPYCRTLPRAAGQKETRIMHLFSGDEAPEIPANTASPKSSVHDRIDQLESQVDILSTRVETVEAKLDDLLQQLT